MFLKLARERECRTVSGVDMFIRQAAIQSKLYTGLEPPREVMARRGPPQARADPLMTIDSPGRRGIALVGYRGTGKSTVGRLLADRLGRPFADADREVEARAGRPIRSIFAEEGEPAFRDLGIAGARRPHEPPDRRGRRDGRRGGPARSQPQGPPRLRLRDLAFGRPRHPGPTAPGVAPGGRGPAEPDRRRHPGRDRRGPRSPDPALSRGRPRRDRDRRPDPRAGRRRRPRSLVAAPRRLVPRRWADGLSLADPPDLRRGAVRRRHGRRQLPERLHLPDSLGKERHLARFALPEVPGGDRGPRQRAGPRLDLPPRGLPELPGADLDPLSRDRAAGRPAVPGGLPGRRRPAERVRPRRPDAPDEGALPRPPGRLAGRGDVHRRRPDDRAGLDHEPGHLPRPGDRRGVPGDPARALARLDPPGRASGSA